MISTKVISSEEMARKEKEAVSSGLDSEKFMETAGEGIACFVEKFLLEHKKTLVVTLLAGKGNNGGDAYVAGVYLLKKGVKVAACAIYPQQEESPLCKKQRERFLQEGGVFSSFDQVKEGVIIDGLVGTGFRGEAKDVLAEAIIWANQSGLPIFAVDIPSGLCGNTGKVGTVAIQAKATIYLELPKIGFFLEQGWDHVGSLVKVRFGLPSLYIEEMHPNAFLVEGVSSSLLPAFERTRNKYEAGYVLVLAGSPNMIGAGILASHAALKSGAGIVRWFYPEEVDALLESIPEVIKVPLGRSFSPFVAEQKRATAILVGPGMGRSAAAYKKMRRAFEESSTPVVIDADALFFLAKHPSFTIPKNAILTPHRGEMQRLLDSHGFFGDLLTACQQYVDKKNTAVLLKGAPNFLFIPNQTPHILPFGNPGMAKAGSGDVLSGILAAFLAQRLSLKDAAILACYLHGLSGDLVVKDKSPFCLLASDLISYLPKAFISLI
jgi:hydroxyethylthiazole kinase-like uncharacterized protein yjeF